MVPVRVSLKENSYNILIGSENLKLLGTTLKSLTLGQDAVVITNPIIVRHHGSAITRSLQQAGLSVKIFTVPSGERSKSAAQAFRLIEQVAAYNVRKRIFIVAFGGGVVGDLAGYVAAAYKRGIPYVQVPTTLLAQIDSAIGGKVGIDLPMGKNLVGAFYQPALVLSDTAVLGTLTKRQVRNGLAEAIKYGIICDHKLFEFIEQNSAALLNLQPRLITELVVTCSQIKARVVSNDERETKGLRTILNFGHTVGHAIEAANRYRDYHHGEAVALGMRVATFISRKMGLLQEDQAVRINRLISQVGLPEKLKKVSLKSILEHMEHDKKFQAGRNKFVLAAGIGSVKVVEDVPRRTIIAAIEAVK